MDIVNDQPNPGVFYKSCLELDDANMTSILAFDSRSMTYLLKDEFSSHFNKTYPLFYKNKIMKRVRPCSVKEVTYFYRNAIDCALKSNQVKAV